MKVVVSTSSEDSSQAGSVMVLETCALHYVDVIVRIGGKEIMVNKEELINAVEALQERKG